MQWLKCQAYTVRNVGIGQACFCVDMERVKVHFMQRLCNMERDERIIVYAAVDRVGEQVISEHMHQRTINICWDMFHVAMVKADSIMKAYGGMEV